MKFLIFVLALSILQNASAEGLDLECVQMAYFDYTKSAKSYWHLKDAEFKRRHPKLHAGFSYLNKEQLNYLRMQEITIDYLVKFQPSELQLDGNNNIYSMVPRYTQYLQEVYRALRKIREFDQLYFENEGYSHNNKMPDYEDLNEASNALIKIDSMERVRQRFDQATEISQTPISKLECGSNE